MKMHTTADRDSERAERRAAIRKLLEHEEIRGQEQLAKRLARLGWRVTQSSVSRDLAELGVAKIAGRYRLAAAALAAPPATEPAPEDVLTETLGASLVSARPAGAHLLVLDTVTGAAQRVAVAIDESGWREIAGTVAGDDTIFVATAGRREQKRLLARLAPYLKEERRL